MLSINRRQLPDWWLDTIAAADRLVEEALDPRALETRRQQGAGFEPADALAYLRAQAAPLLDEHPG